MDMEVFTPSLGSTPAYSPLQAPRSSVTHSPSSFSSESSREDIKSPTRRQREYSSEEDIKTPTRRQREALGTCDEHLHAYLPDTLLRKLQGVEDMADISGSVSTGRASLLFADVKGFSDVAHRLQMHTTSGAELLTTHLNRYFTRLIDVVHAYGGDVALFSGDALIVSWGGDTTMHVSACILCGIALINEVGTYEFSAKGGNSNSNERSSMQFSFSLHVGAAAGPVTEHIVGGGCSSSLGRWKYVLLGECVELAGEAANLGSDGAICIDTGMLEHIAETVHLEGDVLEANPQFFLYRSHTMEEGYRNACPNTTAVREVLMTVSKSAAAGFLFDTAISKTAATGQLRTVSTVFINLCGIMSLSESAEETHAVLNRCVRVLQKALQKLDGVLNKVVMDDKGVICICLFGVPGHTHEDDVSRSLCFSRKVVRKLSHKVTGAVGIARANVFCGLTGSDARKEYTVLGDGVNLAARLMGKCNTAKFEIMCDIETTGQGGGAGRSQNSFLPAGEVLLKGRERTVPCFYVMLEDAIETDTSFTRERSVSQQHLTSSGSMQSLLGKRTRALSKASSRSSCSSFSSAFSAASGYSLQLQNAKSMRKLQSRSRMQSPNGNRVESITDQDMSFITESQGSIAPIPFHIEQEDTELFAREGLLLQLHSFCDSSSPQRLTLVGIPRVGKSRLLDRTRSYVASCGAPLAVLKGSEHPANYESVAESATAALRSIRFDQSYETLANEHGMYLNYVVKCDRLPRPSPAVLAESPTDRLAHCNAALKWLFTRDNSLVLFLVVEDLCKIDNASRSFVNMSLGKGARMVCTERTGFGQDDLWEEAANSHDETSSSSSAASVLSLGFTSGSAPAVRQHTGDSVELVVPPLEEESHNTMVASLLKSEVDPALLKQLYTVTEGVCGYTESVVKHLLQGGYFTSFCGQVVLVGGGELPDSLVHHVAGVESTVLRIRDTMEQPLLEAINIMAVLSITSCVKPRFISACVLRCQSGALERSHRRRKSDGYTDNLDLSATFKTMSARDATPRLLQTPLIKQEGAKLSFVHKLARDAVYVSMLETSRCDYHELAAMLLESDIELSDTHSVDLFLHKQKAHLHVSFDTCYNAFLESLRNSDYITAHTCLSGYMHTLPQKSPRRAFLAFNLCSLGAELGGGKNESGAVLYRDFAAIFLRRTSIIEQVSPREYTDRLNSPRRERREENKWVDGELVDSSASTEDQGSSNHTVKKKIRKRWFCCGGDMTDTDEECAAGGGAASVTLPSTTPDRATNLGQDYVLRVPSRMVPADDDSIPQFLVVSALRLQCELAFWSSNKNLYLKTAAMYAEDTGDRLYEHVGSFLLREKRAVPRTRHECPLTALLVMTKTDARDVTDMSMLALESHDDYPIIKLAGHRRLLAGPRRKSARCALMGIKAMCELLHGDLSFVVTIRDLRESQLPRWSQLALFLKLMASNFVHTGPRQQHADVMEEINSFSDITDTLLAPCISATQYSLLDMETAVQDLKAQVTNFLTPYHALAATVLFERLLPVLDKMETTETIDTLLNILMEVCALHPISLTLTPHRAPKCIPSSRLCTGCSMEPRCWRRTGRRRLCCCGNV